MVEAKIIIISSALTSHYLIIINNARANIYGDLQISTVSRFNDIESLRILAKHPKSCLISALHAMFLLFPENWKFSP